MFHSEGTSITPLTEAVKIGYGEQITRKGMMAGANIDECTSEMLVESNVVYLSWDAASPGLWPGDCRAE